MERELLSFTCLFLQALFCDSFGESGSGHPKQLARSSRSMQHPAFSMMMGTPMGFPGSPMQGGSGSDIQSECITEDIICPAWCLMEDEWGCKYCPCGPANGMSPAKVSEHRHSEIKHEENTDCIGTILCMLSCKDGYKLGPRDREHGCQSCTCVKKNETKADNNTGQNQNSEPCAWPLCMNGNGPNNGPGNGASMTSLPIGGVKAGGSLPGVDCLGSSCSAKNGMRTMDNASPAMKPLIPPAQSPTTSSFPRPTTKRPQSAGHVDHLSQKTLLLMPPTTKSPSRLFLAPVPTEAPNRLFLAPVPTEAPRQQYLAQLPTEAPRQQYLAQLPTEASRLLYLAPEQTEAPRQLYLAQVPTQAPKRRCATLEFCMNNCQYGFQVQNSRQECPDCSCILRGQYRHPVAVSQVPRPQVVQPSSLHCIGPQCSAINAVPQRLQLLCEQPLACPYGCTVGFKCDSEGCPICSCIAPSETAYKTEIQKIVVERVLKCDAKFSCQDRCAFGFKTGADGCPSCTCLQPIAVFDRIHDQQPIVAPHHVQPIAVPHMPVIEAPGVPAGITPDVPKNRTVMEACPETVKCMVECGPSYKLTQMVGGICPDCKCIHDATGCFGPSCSAPGSHSPIEEISTPSPGECVAILHCVMTCESGYDIGEYSSDGCPSCTCVQ